ncbi:hypothetical protein Unana1_00636 [Umbelopsis nana]
MNFFQSLTVPSFTQNDVHPAGLINLKEYHYAHPESIKKLPYAFSILSKDRTRRPYVLYAENSQDMMIWLETLRTLFKERSMPERKLASNISTSSTTDTNEENTDSVLDKWLHRLDLDEPKRNRDLENLDQVSVASSHTEGTSSHSHLQALHVSRRSTESLASSVQSDSASSILSTSSSGTDMSQVSSPNSPTVVSPVTKLTTQLPPLQPNQQDMSRTRMRANRYGVKSLHSASVSPPALNSFLTQQPSVPSHMSSATNIEQNPFFNPRIPPRNRNRLPVNDKRSPPASPRSFIMRPDQILSAGPNKDLSWIEDGPVVSNQKRSSCPPIDSIP